MKSRVITMALIAAPLFGCASYEGTYSPACVAYAGSTITLSEGQFAWEKFTDQRVVDKDGEIVNQFPGYPLRGSYSTNGQVIHMESDTGEPVQTMYLSKHDDRYYLLTAAQFAAWEKTASLADCALRLGGKREAPTGTSR